MKRAPITHHFLLAKDRPADWKAARFKRHKSWLELTWREYFERAEAAARGLSELGVTSGDRVAILSNSRFEWAVLDFAVLGMGAVTIPIYQSSRGEEVEFILKDSQPKVLIVEDESQLKKWEAISKRCKSVEHVVLLQPQPESTSDNWISWDDLLERGTRAAKPNWFAKQIESTKLFDLATIVYTSGTTGEPKGAELTHLQIVSEVEDTARAFPVSPEDSTLSFLPYAHVLGRVEIWLHVYAGFTLNFAEGIDRLRQNLKETRPTVIIGVPRIFEKVYASVMSEIQGIPWRRSLFEWLNRPADGWLALPRRLAGDFVLFEKIRAGLGGRLRFAVSGGAPLDPEIGRFFQRAGVLIMEGYGLTETTAAITANTPEAYQFGTVGKPLGDVEIRLADDGEILVKSQKVMRGYHGDPIATRAVLQDGFFSTGDIGEFTPEGFLRITDRKKDLIKTAGGKYVAPQKIENLLKLDPLISHALIHGDRKKYVIALITLDTAVLKQMARQKGWAHRDLKSLTQSHDVHEYVRKCVAQVNSQLASYETVKHFAILPNDFTVESGELTPSLKVKRRICDERYRDVIESLY